MNLQSSIPQSARPTRAQAKAYNPSPFRRRLMPGEILPGAIHVFSCYSLTRNSKAIRHHQEVDTQTGEVRCSCEHFTYRLAKLRPTMDEGRHHCKHIAKALDWLQRHGVTLSGAAQAEYSDAAAPSACACCGSRELSHDVQACEQAAYAEFDAWRAEMYSQEGYYA